VTPPGVKQQRVREPPYVLGIGPTVRDAGECFDRHDVAERTSATATEGALAVPDVGRVLCHTKDSRASALSP
jgi:hypothetical protein